ncbi:MAG: ribose-5-phosphate isomerase RpiA [Anaerolineales bacterium]
MAGNEDQKRQAAEAAVELLRSGMVVGLGHGSTVKFALAALAAKLKSGELDKITGVACSKQTEGEALRLGIPLTELSKGVHIDVTIDGADEVDPQLNLIKGGGGGLLREKIVAQASAREIIAVDESKLSERLGTKHALPIEVSQFGWMLQLDYIQELGGKAALRQGTDGQPALTDQVNYLLDADFGPIADYEGLARMLEARSGILEHGLFLDLATDVIVAGVSGLRHLKANR